MIKMATVWGKNAEIDNGNCKSGQILKGHFARGSEQLGDLWKWEAKIYL